MGSLDKPGMTKERGPGERSVSHRGLVGPAKWPGAAYAASDTGLDSSSESPAITSTITSMPVKAPAGPL